MNFIGNEKLYVSFINGANVVMHNRMFLNKINVFPVADGDTGSNLFSTMQSIVHYSELKADLKRTLESIADSAILGARGNSGLIFAQYFQGLSEGITSDDNVSMDEFVEASQKAMVYAYEAIENPVEGTMLTTMKVFHDSLNDGLKNEKSLIDLLEIALEKVEKAVEKTPDQLKILKQSSVVDSGAKGFAYFIKGFVDGIKGHFVVKEDTEDTMEIIPEIEHNHDEEITYRYCTEALIEKENNKVDFKSLLHDLGDSLIQVNGKYKSRLHIHTNNPTAVFERLSKEGTLIEQKVDDMVIQYDRVHHRKYKSVIVTDSIADLPQELLDDGQVHVVHLSLVLHKETFIDKLTISNERLLELSKNKKNRPTSSQPTLKSLDNMYNYLLSYYEDIIVFSVADALSGTYNAFVKAAMPFNQKKEKIHVIDTKQNSVAQGLIVLDAIERLKNNESVESIKKEGLKAISNSKILVKINALDHMIASGRLSVKAGSIAKKIGLKPIVTLNEKGEGSIFKISFSSKGSLRKISNHLKHIEATKGIKSYAVTYVDDEALGNNFADALTLKLKKKPVYVTKSSGIIAMGAGKGAVAVAYITR